MNLLHISHINQKGQLVIPHSIRKDLNINPHTPLHIVKYKNSLSIKPIKTIIYHNQSTTPFSHILDKTAGSWHQDSWPKTRQKRKKTELSATKKRKHSW